MKFLATFASSLLVLPGVLAAPQLLQRQTSTDLSTPYTKILDQIKLTQYAPEVYESKRTKNQNKFFYRKPYHDLTTSMTEANKAIDAKQTALFYFFADTVSYADAPIDVHAHATVYIYSRRLVGPKTLTLKYSSRVTLVIIGPSLPDGFTINFVGGDGSTKSTPLKFQKYGAIVNAEEGSKELTVEHVGLPNKLLAGNDYMDDLKAGADAFVEDDLPRLLQFQLMLAFAWMDTDRKTALELLSYVRNTTAEAPETYNLYIQSTTLLGRLAITSDISESYVPNLDIKLTKENLQLRLAVATDFEKQFSDFAALERSSKDAQNMAVLLYNQSDFTTKQYEFLETQAKEKMESAEISLNEATKRFQYVTEDIKIYEEAFKRGIEVFKTEQKLKMAFEIFSSIVAFVAEVGLSVAMPAAAPAAAPKTAAEVAGILTYAVESGEQILSTSAKILKTLSDIKPLIENINKTVKIIKSTLDAMSKLKPNGDFSKGIPTRPEDRDDFQALMDAPNMKAQWDIFYMQATDSWDSVKDKSISGAKDYFQSLRSMSQLGKAIIVAQAAYAQTADEYMRATMQRVAAQSQTQRLKDHVNSMTQPNVYATFKKAMFDRLMSIRSWVAIDYAQYLAAYRYYSLDEKSVAAVPVMSPTNVYVGKAQELQAAINDAIPRVQSQTGIFNFSSNDPNSIFPVDWKSQLSNGRPMTFTIPVNASVFDTYTRVRLQNVRLYFLNTKAQQVNVDIKVSGHFADKPLKKGSAPMAFVSDDTKLQWKYRPSAQDPHGPEGNVVMDGQFVHPELYMQPTPFADWNVKVTGTGADAITDATEIAMEIKCEVKTDGWSRFRMF